MTQDPDTAVVMCDNVKGLGITLDPSHYIYGPHAGGELRPGDEARLPRAAPRHHQGQVCRSASARAKSSTAGWSTNCTKVHYDRALCVDMPPMPDVDQLAEMRKMRLLLESLL